MMNIDCIFFFHLNFAIISKLIEWLNFIFSSIELVNLPGTPGEG